MFNHHLQPLLEILLHTNSASFKEFLDSLNLSLKLLEFSILLLVSKFQLVNFTLHFLLFWGLDYLSTVIDHASHRILLPNLLDLIS